jgi:hypothetical protein
VVSFRCTQKLLKRWPGSIEPSPPPPTTVLGDWFCTALNHRARRLVLGVAERSLLPVVVPAKEFATFPERFVKATRLVLATLGVPAVLRVAEVEAMRDWALAKTNNRSILGSLRDLRFMALVFLDQHPDAQPEAIAADLAGVPCGPLEHVFPGRQTQILFRAA